MRILGRLLFVVLFCVACASHSPKSETPVKVLQSAPASLSFLEISYQRGRNSYKLQVEKKSELVFARSYVDQSLAQEKKLSDAEFSALQKKTEVIFKQGSTLTEAASYSHCRTPFEIEMSTGADTKKMRGCRSTGVGPQVNELLHDADLMLMQE